MLVHSFVPPPSSTHPIGGYLVDGNLGALTCKINRIKKLRWQNMTLSELVIDHGATEKSLLL